MRRFWIGAAAGYRSEAREREPPRHVTHGVVRTDPLVIPTDDYTKLIMLRSMCLASRRSSVPFG